MSVETVTEIGAKIGVIIGMIDEDDHLVENEIVIEIIVVRDEMMDVETIVGIIDVKEMIDVVIDGVTDMKMIENVIEIKVVIIVLIVVKNLLRIVCRRWQVCHHSLMTEIDQWIKVSY